MMDDAIMPQRAMAGEWRCAVSPDSREERLIMLKIRFEGGISRYDDGAVNYLMPEPFDAATQEALVALGDDADELYEERNVDDDSTECAGYDDMADAMAAKLEDMGVDLRDVEWWFGGDEDGRPKHVGE